MKHQPSRRKRGILLTELGYKKMMKGKTEAEFANNKGKPYTKEELSEITGLSVDTCSKILHNEIPFDRNSLRDFFQAFHLSVEPNDYYLPDDVSPPPPILELPEGQVPLTSLFYVERSPIESHCYQAILQPGALLRIKAPHRTGKTSLMMRILDYGQKKNCKTLYLRLSLAKFENLEVFLKWFCASITKTLKLPNRVNDYWDDLFGSKMSCQFYFEQYLLDSLSQPLILALDEVDFLFQYPDLADDFFALLRAWHEAGKNQETWQKLRLMVAHSTEVYIPLKVNHSPFNVGIPIELPEFTPDQVQDLAQRYKLDWTEKEVQQLMNLVGGHPYLIRWSLYHISQEEVTLESLLKEPISSPNSIYKNHLQSQLLNLQKHPPSLIQAYLRVLMSEQPIDLNLIEAFQLQSLGLVQLKSNQVMPSYPLYTQYFRQYFQENSSKNWV